MFSTAEISILLCDVLDDIQDDTLIITITLLAGAYAVWGKVWLADRQQALIKVWLYLNAAQRKERLGPVLAPVTKFEARQVTKITFPLSGHSMLFIPPLSHCFCFSNKKAIHVQILKSCVAQESLLSKTRSIALLDEGKLTQISDNH